MKQKKSTEYALVGVISVQPNPALSKVLEIGLRQKARKKIASIVAREVKAIKGVRLDEVDDIRVTRLITADKSKWSRM